MRIAFLIVSLLTSFVGFSQDPEFPDTRNKRESFTKIQDKAMRTDISCFAMAGLDEGVGKQPLRALPLAGVGSDSIAFEGNGVYVKIKAGNFDASKHKLGYYTNQDSKKKYLTKI